MVTLVAKWSNGVKREFPHQDTLNCIINKAELEMWCEENNFEKPTFEEVPETDPSPTVDVPAAPDDLKSIPNELTANFGDIDCRRKLMDMYGDSKTMYSGVNAEGEEVWVSIAKDSIVVTTNQKNGWVRKNFYDEEGFAAGETFEGRWKVGTNR